MDRNDDSEDNDDGDNYDDDDGDNIDEDYMDPRFFLSFLPSRRKGSVEWTGP